MPSPFAARDAAAAPIWFVTRDTWDAMREALPAPSRAFAQASGFKPKAGHLALLPDAQGGLAGALFAVEEPSSRLHDPLAAGALASKLPAGAYRFANDPPGGARARELAALGFALSSYRFTRYRGEPFDGPQLVAPEGVDAARLARVAESLVMARDLVNTPANDMGPAALEAAALSLAREYGARAHAIAGDAFRPGDIYPSRKGLSVEIGNTDAEGRLVLADALALADEEAPELLFDFATLTGAARVALGPEIAPFYTMDNALADAIARHGMEAADPVWRMPLWDNYDKLLDSKSADLCNVSSGPFAGSITAALFLRRFVEKTPSWTHFDIYGWNASARPGRPEGGEAQTARLLYDLIEARVKA